MLIRNSLKEKLRKQSHMNFIENNKIPKYKFNQRAEQSAHRKL